MSLRLVERARGGESGGAWIVEDPAGTRFVFKWSRGGEFRIDDAAVITARLRERGYPLPAYQLTGRDGDLGYLVRKLLPGKPMARLEGHHLNRLFELTDLQAGAAAGTESDWPAAIIESVLTGFDDWCVLDTLRRHSSETAAVLAELQWLVPRNSAGRFRTADAVHFDFNPANSLVEGDRIVGVVDWDGARAGDRAFDLATLLFYHYEDAALRERLWRRAHEIASGGAIALYLAHMIVRQVDWSLRHHPPEVGERYIGLARRVLREIGGQ